MYDKNWAKSKIGNKFIRIDFKYTEQVGEASKDGNCNRNGEKYRFSVCSGYQCSYNKTNEMH